MAAPILYRWDDGNAPVARGERRSLCDILYACLVTGYGSKPGAGWTREYVNATFDKAAFRNNPATGTGFFLQVDGAGSTNAFTSKIQGYESMTSESVGLFPFTTVTVYPLKTSDSPGTTARPWVLLADDRAFYFICWPSITTTPGNSNSLKSELFFGDIIKFKPDDAYACLLVPSDGEYGAYWNLTNPSTAIGSNKFMPRKSDGVATPYSAALIRGGGPGDDSAPGQNGYPYSAGGPVLISRPHLNEGASYSLRGWVPGFYYPCHTMAFNQLATVTVDGKSFLSIRGYVEGGHMGNYFISLDDWRA